MTDQFCSGEVNQTKETHRQDITSFYQAGDS